MLTAEGRTKAKVRKYLRDRGAYVYSPVPMGYGATTLDDLVCLDGVFIALEYKRAGKKPTPRQREIMRAIEDAHGVVIWGDDPLKIISELEHLWATGNLLRA